MKILEIPPGGKVEGPGLYRMSMDDYHSQDAFPGPSVSSTGIRKCVLGSPRAYRRLVLEAVDQDEKAAYVIGRAVHSLVLGDEVFMKQFAIIPNDAPPRPTAAQVRAFKRTGEWSKAARPRAEFWEAMDARIKGRTVLKEDDAMRVKAMAESVAESPEARSVLVSPFVEVSMIWQDPVTGLWLKARPDVIPVAGADLADLKTISPRMTNIKLAVHRAITDYGYYIQMALASMGAEAIFGEPADRAALVFVQTTEPHETVPVEIDTDAIYWGKCLVRRGLDLIAHGMETGEWPGCAKGFLKYTIPPSLETEFSDQQIAGDLPNGPYDA